MYCGRFFVCGALILAGCEVAPRGLLAVAANQVLARLDRIADQGSFPKIREPVAKAFGAQVDSAGRVSLDRERPASRLGASPGGRDSRFASRLRLDELYFELSFKF